MSINGLGIQGNNWRTEIVVKPEIKLRLSPVVLDFEYIFQTICLKGYFVIKQKEEICIFLANQAA